MIPRLPKGFSHPMVIGAGSFSSVYRARQRALDRWVAIKILPEKNPVIRQTLLKEAQVQAQLNAPCIPAVYDAFEWDQQVCIVMQWIKGISLKTILDENPNSEQRHLIAVALFESLAGLHRLGFAHRDLKPANILISPQDGLYLVDFGFSKNIVDGEKSIANMIKGTPAFMAPELWQAGQATDYLKADLFAVGKILELIQPSEKWAPLIQLCLQEKPENRPVSASAVWSSWQTLLTPIHSRDWKSLAEARASAHLADHLLPAAKNLIHAGKFEEAYWLLSECLEENPDSAEALRLMDQFPTLSRKKSLRQKLSIGAIAATFILTLFAAFYFGKQTERQRILPGSSKTTPSTAFFLPRHHSSITTKWPNPLKVFSKKNNRISGWLMISNADSCDTLLLDGESLSRQEWPKEFPLAHGPHTLLCLDSLTGRRSKEKFHLLPFQRKRIGLASIRKPAEKG